MGIINTEKQKDNLAKYLYDISKIIFAVAVVSPFAKPENIDKYTLIVGISVSLMFFITASFIDREKVNF